MKTETKRELFHKVPHRDTGDGCAGCRLQSLLAGGCSQVTVLAKRLQVWTQDALGSARGEEGGQLLGPLAFSGALYFSFRKPLHFILELGSCRRWKGVWQWLSLWNSVSNIDLRVKVVSILHWGRLDKPWRQSEFSTSFHLQQRSRGRCLGLARWEWASFSTSRRNKWEAVSVHVHRPLASVVYSTCLKISGLKS